MTALHNIEGIGTQFHEKLEAAGVKSVEDLLAIGATPKGRRDLAGRTGLSPKRILRWVNHADLFRIRGIAAQFAELLEAAGVDTVAELAYRNGANLHAKLDEINAARKLVRQVPAQTQVNDFITQARSLDRVIHY